MSDFHSQEEPLPAKEEAGSIITFKDSKWRVERSVVPHFTFKKDAFLALQVVSLKISHMKMLTNGGWII